jgi:inward rectifier potassium channel
MFKFARNNANREMVDNRDLGFGSFVSEASRKRLLNRDGTFNVSRTGLPFLGSLNLYHWLLNLTWPRLVGLIVVVYLVLNVVFAGAYMLCGPNALAGNVNGVGAGFWRAYFFSVHTFATIGYGNVTPFSMSANIVVTIESLVGLLGFAFGAGLLFARFSRPTAKILFSKKAVVAPYRDGSGFMFRITNGRKNQLVELQMKLIFTRFEGEDGSRIRKYYFLDLERRSVAFFPLAWTIVHPITESSPLYGVDWEQFDHDRAEFLVLLNGFDETFSQTVHTRSSYIAAEIECEAKFVSMYNPLDDDDEDLSIDVRRLNNTEPAPLPEMGTEG